MLDCPEILGRQKGSEPSETTPSLLYYLLKKLFNNLTPLLILFIQMLAEKLRQTKRRR